METMLNSQDLWNLVEKASSTSIDARSQKEEKKTGAKALLYIQQAVVDEVVLFSISEAKITVGSVRVKEVR